MTGNQAWKHIRFVKSLWFIGGVCATLSLTVLLTNFIHPDLYGRLRGHNYLMSMWNTVVDFLAIGSINPLWINAIVVVLCAALPMFYMVMKHPIYSEAGRRQKIGILFPLINLPILSIISARLYKPYRDPALELPDKTVFDVFSQWGSNLMYGGLIGLLASLFFAFAVIYLVKSYRPAIALTLGVLFVCQLIGIAQN